MNRNHNLILNLQLFAANTQTTTTAGLSDEMKTFYEDRLIDYAEPNLVHDQFGDEYPIPANGGKTIEFRKYDSLSKATTPLTEGVTPDGQSLNVSTITATVAQYGGYITISDMLKMSAIDNNILQALKILGSQAGRTLDTITRDVLAGGTNVIYANGAASRDVLYADSAFNQIKVVDVFKAAAQLEAMNAPKIDGSYVAIIHPYVAFDLMTSSDWIDVHKYADPDAIFKGEIGKLGNVRFVSSTEAKIWNDSTCPIKTNEDEEHSIPATYYSVFSTLVLGANAYGKTAIEGGGLETIVKQLGAGDDPLNQRATVGWKATKVAERLVEQYMVRIESVSSTYSATAAAN